TQRLDYILFEQKYFSNINLFNINSNVFNSIVKSKILEKINIRVLKVDESLSFTQLQQLNSLRIFSYLDNVTYLELSGINYIFDLCSVFNQFYSNCFPNPEELIIGLLRCFFYSFLIYNDDHFLKQFSSLLCEHVLFKRQKKSLRKPNVSSNKFPGVCLESYAFISKNYYIQLLSIDIFNYKDLLVIFDNFPLLNYLSVELARLSSFYSPQNRYPIDDTTYDYKVRVLFDMLEANLSKFGVLLLQFYGTRISQMLSNIPDLEKSEFQIEFEIHKWTRFTPSHRSLTEESFININKWNIVFNFDKEQNHYSIFTLPAVSHASYHFHSLSSTLRYTDSNYDYSSIRKIEIFGSFSQSILCTELAKILTVNFSKLTTLTISNQVKNIGKSDTSSESKLRLNCLKYLEIKQNIAYLDQLRLLVPNLTSLFINDIQCLENICVKNNIKYLGSSGCNQLPNLNKSFQNIQNLEILFEFIESPLSWINDREISMFCEMINNMKNLISLHILISTINENENHFTNIMYEMLKNDHKYCLIQTLKDEQIKSILV
ncbi:unnamed protein product, partial [Didymodactylos carnosus]